MANADGKNATVLLSLDVNIVLAKKKFIKKNQKPKTESMEKSVLKHCSTSDKDKSNRLSWLKYSSHNLKCRADVIPFSKVS